MRIGLNVLKEIVYGSRVCTVNSSDPVFNHELHSGCIDLHVQKKRILYLWWRTVNGSLCYHLAHCAWFILMYVVFPCWYFQKALDKSMLVSTLILLLWHRKISFLCSRLGEKLPCSLLSLLMPCNLVWINRREPVLCDDKKKKKAFLLCFVFSFSLKLPKT